MKPVIEINFNEVFANTKFHEELSSIIFGSELALKYGNVSDSQIKDIRDKIVRSAFASFTLDYNVMLAAVQSVGSFTSPQMSEPSPQTDRPQANSGLSGTFKADESDLYQNVPDQDYGENNPPVQEPYNPAEYSYHAPVSSDFDMDINDDFEHTVVYENYAGSAKKTDSSPDLSFGYGKHPDTLWESENNKDENAGLGKIRWTTYSSSSDTGGEPTNPSSNEFGHQETTDDTFITA